MITLFGIKNCDTVKKARRWLDSEGISYQFHDFRIDGITTEQVTEWLNNVGPETLINKRSTTWKNLPDDDKQNVTIDQALSLIIEHPTLIKRPLLQDNNTIHLGFKESHYTLLFK